MLYLPQLNSRYSLLSVIAISLCITFSLGAATWSMNFWHSDVKAYYFDAVLKLPTSKYLSQMHAGVDDERIRWLHGKELYILTASWMQRLMMDFKTIRPFVWVCLISLCGASILIFTISRFYWGHRIAWVVYFLFITSFWPYMYILFAKHHLQGLFCYLGAHALLMRAPSSRRSWVWLLSSGLALGTALFSSTIAAAYLPYYAAGFLYAFGPRGERSPLGSFPSLKAQDLRLLSLNGLMVLLGVFLIVGYVNFPDIIGNLKKCWEYVKISGEHNHFFYNQRVLIEWMEPHRINRGGWLWVIKFFRMFMPVLFPLSLLGAGYLLSIYGPRLREKGAKPFFMILLAFSSPLLAEVKGVAQYAANYFPSFLGILLLIGYSLHVFFQEHRIEGDSPLFKESVSFRFRAWALFFLTAVISHILINFSIFITDIYPTRLATTFISKKIDELGLKRIYTYRNHPQAFFILTYLNPKTLERVRFTDIQHIYQPQEGYILIPPISGNSIYIAATSAYTDFDADLFLNTIVRRGLLKKYAVASFKTLVSSRYWPHEEEILTYRYLILNQFPEAEQEKSKVWILDVAKLRRDPKPHIPPDEDRRMVSQGIRNIGTKTRVYLFTGSMHVIPQPVHLQRLSVRMYKVGRPQDQLRAYLYKVEQKQPVWIPNSSSFTSRPLEGRALTRDPLGEMVTFSFSDPQRLSPGPYSIVIYRTGPASDEHFYRIYKDEIGKQEFPGKFSLQE